MSLITWIVTNLKDSRLMGMTYFMLDVEANGQPPAVGEMSAFGCIAIPKYYAIEPVKYYGFLGILNRELYGDRPKTSDRVECVMAGETDFIESPKMIMESFNDWIKTFTVKQPMFISDNNGWDYQWINFYFWKYLGYNPFGHSSTNLGSLYKGLVKNFRKNFKYLRKTKHDHNPCNDALGNVEAFIHLLKEYKL